ncbi:MAG: hypothetical protein M0P64_02075 [Candidatus Pacebacteria bacterium]|jgi:hypothetical protein|nr:hypothetical protein [Candidatus Paceibacterota bacterium]
MNNHEPKKNIKEAILRKIETRELSMRPKLYFTLRIVSIAVLALAVLLISVFILNFILFSIRINSHEALLSFGPRGWSAFFHFFPWVPLLLDVVLVVALSRLLRHFRFGYKTPVLYLLGALIVATSLVGITVERGTHINERLLRQSDERGLPPPFGGMYGHARRNLPPGAGVCLCTVLSIEGNTLSVQDTKSTTTLKVLIPENSRRATTTGLVVGETIFVAGEVKDGVMQAFGIKKAEEGFPRP